MYLKDISEVPFSLERAVIINCGTKEVSTLALLSTLRHGGMPVLMIDCESADGSVEHFLKLMEEYHFDLLSAPLFGHGITLDRVFKRINANKVLLVDSDIEILDSVILRFMRDYIDEPNTFGAGFVQGPTWIDDCPGSWLEGALYQQRIWMPLAFLKVKRVQEALAAGVSFKNREIYNDFFFSEGLSRLWAYAKIRHPILKRFQTPNWLRRTYYGFTPSIVYCDTGAEMFQHLKYRRELAFAGLPARYNTRYVTHFGGFTRFTMGNAEDHEKSKIPQLIQEVRRRLKEGYGVVVDG